MLKVLTSWDDGRRQDLRLAELLKKYNIPAIFFIPNNCELLPHEIKKLAESFEIGGHTVSHPQDITKIDEELAAVEIQENKEWLEKLTSYPLKWFCYPRGRYNEAIKRIVLDAGFQYARTTKVGRIELLMETNMEAHTSAHIYDRREYGPMGWYEYAFDLIQNNFREQGILHIWGHSWEIDKFGFWEDLERLFAVINGLGLEKLNIKTLSNEGICYS